MPRQKPLPAVLAVVLMDQRLIIVAASVFRVAVEVVDLSKRVT